MITNNKITYYHKVLNNTTHLEEWSRVLFENVWIFGGKGSNINKGYENANDVNVRIPMMYVTDTDLFQIGDIVALGEQGDITKQSDLDGKDFYNVTSIRVNDFGSNPHIHLGGE